MFLLFPVGVDEAKVDRVPWCTLTIAILCVLCFFATWVLPTDPMGVGADDIARVTELWYQHPDLDLPDDFRARYLSASDYAKLQKEREQHAAQLEAHRAGLDADGEVLDPDGALARPHFEDDGPADEAARERMKEDRQEKLQIELDTLAADVIARADSSGMRRFGLIPARGFAQPGWITAMFLHFGWMHILGNFLFLYLVGLLLEDAWGRPVFVGFYLLGGVVANLAHFLLDPSSTAVMAGASGAIAACMGAFTLRFATRRVQMAYLLFIGMRLYRGIFRMPAWAWGLCWFAMEVFDFLVHGSATGVAVMAHIGGFLFGLAVAAGMRFTAAEQKFIQPALDAKLGQWRQNPHVEAAQEALLRGDAAFARSSFEKALQVDPQNSDAELGLATLDLKDGNLEQAKPRLDRALSRLAVPGKEESLWPAMEELGALLDPKILRPQLSYRIATVLDAAPEGVRPNAERFFVAAAAAGGALAAKSWVRAAERRFASTGLPQGTQDYLANARALGALPPELQQAVTELEQRMASLPPGRPTGPIELDLPEPPPPPTPRAPRITSLDPAALGLAPSPEPAAAQAPEMLAFTGSSAAAPAGLGAPDPGAEVPMMAPLPVDLPPMPDAAPTAAPLAHGAVAALAAAPAPAPAPGAAYYHHCRVLQLAEGALELEAESGRRRRINLGEILGITVGVVPEPATATAPARHTLFTDLVLSWGVGGSGPTVVRLKSTTLGLPTLYPSLPPKEAYGQFLKHLLEHSSAPTVPEREALASGRYPRYADPKQLELAVRSLASVAR